MQSGDVLFDVFFFCAWVILFGIPTAALLALVALVPAIRRRPGLHAALALIPFLAFVAAMWDVIAPDPAMNGPAWATIGWGMLAVIACGVALGTVVVLGPIALNRRTPAAPDAVE